MIKRIALGLALLAFPVAAQAQQSPFQAAAPSLPVSGTWTPVDASGAALTFTAVSAGYTLIGNMVFVYGTLTYPSTADGSNAKVGGLPFTIANQNYGQTYQAVGFNAVLNGVSILPQKNTTTFAVTTFGSAGSRTNANLTAGVLTFNFAYPIN